MELCPIIWGLDQEASHKLFKIWKSHMSFEKVNQISHNQLQIMLTARFIMYVLINFTSSMSSGYIKNLTGTWS